MNLSHTEKEIDAAWKVPAFFFLSSSAVWLLLGVITGTVALIKHIEPSFLQACEYVSYGRVFAAFQNIFVFGWLGNLAFLVIPWIMSRLSGTKIPSWFILLVCGKFWNIGVTLAVIFSFIGQITGMGLFDTAPLAAWILMGSYAIAMTWSVVILILRNKPQIFISQWFLVVAVFALPWVISIAYFLTGAGQARGVLPSIIGAWYEYNLVWMWIVPLALGIIFYAIPKFSGVLLQEYYLAEITFGSFIFIATWGGTQHLFGGPFPAWIPTVGQSAVIALFFPGILLSSMFLKTFFSGASQIVAVAPLRFISFAGFALVFLFIFTFLSGFSSTQELLSLTFFRQALTWQAILLVGSMALSGAVYLLVPKVFQTNWPLSFLVSFHFIASSLGGFFIVLGWYLAAFAQGNAINALDDAGVPLLSSTEIFTGASEFLFISVIGILLLGIGAMAFVLNIVFLLTKVAWSSANCLLSLILNNEQPCVMEGAKG